MSDEAAKRKQKIKNAVRSSDKGSGSCFIQEVRVTSLYEELELCPRFQSGFGLDGIILQYAMKRRWAHTRDNMRTPFRAALSTPVPYLFRRRPGLHSAPADRSELQPCLLRMLREHVPLGKPSRHHLRRTAPVCRQD